MEDISFSGGFLKSLVFFGLWKINLYLDLLMAFFSVSLCLSFLSKVPVFEFRVKLNLGCSHLEIFALITSAKTLICNKVTF